MNIKAGKPSGPISLLYSRRDKAAVMGRCCSALFCLAVCVLSRAAASLGPGTTDNQVLETNSLGDVYLDRVQQECTHTRSPFKCFKYKALKYLHRWTNEGRQASSPLWGPISIISTQTTTSGAATMPSIFADTQPRATDSEIEQLAKYSQRQLERYVSTHALLWTLPSALEGARLIDDENLSAVEEEEGRSRRKKKLSVLLPLLLFMKLKALLIPILLIVIFIKKMLLVGAFLVPSLLSHLKQKEHHIHATSHEHGHHDTSEWGGYGAGDSYGRIGKRAAFDMAYRGYKKA